ncbi:efflux RND transporter permease subunit [Aureimonas phyllosphaerae]|uniref:Hydrophobe/amphiphile efflux-1 (HAE1) family protein n=1 Tax=Aureimonas phyllosphaerae TaxID=1166078 RepID=A0A7W6BZY1_9HYPH|nr:efflux RND transporter permease subunit [Aureimonas phyllosphaerae]MBB3938293.1 hydrophobe/amphiphile efflux-1 (HAE1) family protein [Aureimonas phyllosphaerae]MBB3962300.1 hydrophobe/amphiphile efflux-1 (HAE1) family protein [Aureimonas phyllosphaerae]SFF59582.1 hydrophobe/amphiphile efflux-1 (HAE1) family protein [Aureimonas phyllosphaerae]
MNISTTFIRRPVATLLLCLAVLLAGIAAYRLLPVAALPQADYPTISVSAQLAGASPDTMASAVATPLIKQFETIDGIDTITARSSLGNTQITIQFVLSRDIDAAAADVQAAIARSTRQLPDNMTTPPSYRKANPADAPILLLDLVSQGTPLTEVDDLAENLISPALSTIQGVAQAQVYGAKTFAVRVGVDPDKLAARSLSMSQVSTALAAANSQTPVGTIQTGGQALTVDAPTQRTNADEFRTLVIARPNGVPVRLGDVAKVEDSVDNLNQGSWLDGKPAIVLAVQRQPGANTVEVVDAIKAKLPELQAALPASVQLQVVNDASVSISAAVDDVQQTLGLTILLVILVIYLFLGRLSATMIPAITVPLSLVATFGAMYLLGYSIDNLSLLALTLSVGLVVDDAIVMLENIVRHVEDGASPMEAALQGSGEVSGTIVSMSLSLVAVFLPILLMGGVVGRVLNEFGVVVALAILASAVVSLTLTPMLAARLPATHAPTSGLAASFTRGFDRAAAVYGRMVDWCLHRNGFVMAVFVLSFAASAVMMATLPRSFLPQEDNGLLTISTQARQDISYAAMSALQARAAAAVKADPAVSFVTSTLEAGPGGATFNSGSMFVQLKPKDQRPPIEQTLSSLRRELGAVPGLKSFATPVQSLRFGGRSTQSQYQLVVQSLDAGAARQWSARILDAMRADPSHFVDVATDLQDNGLQERIKVDRDRADALGVDPAGLRTALEAGFGTLTAAQIQSTGNSYDVILEYDQSGAWTDDRLAAIRVPAANGTLVPLAAFATLSREAGPVTVNQTGQLTAVTLSFNLPAGVSLGTATATVEAIKSQLQLPSNVSTSYAGTAQVFQQATGNLGLLIGAAVLVIYIVLGILYESFIHPLTILSGLPSAAFGALAALQWFGFDLSIIAVIGLLMLIGIVKKNAIMMVDVALELQREEGQGPEAAIREACLRRFRPIMMTTFCALLGALPIALGTGVSSELRQPLGVAVVGGLLVSQALTLFITPVIFVEIERARRFVGRRLLRRQTA